MPFTHTWLPYIYLYGVGGLLFLVGVVVTIKSGSLDIKRKSHKNWFIILFFGMAWFMVMHALWNMAALEILSLETSLILWLIFMIGSLTIGYFKFGKKERA